MRPGGATLSLYCQGLNQSTQRHREERRADQPAPRHRPDRQARRRAVLAHRPAQRDGRARGRRPGQPAVRAPRPRQPRAPRRGRRAVGRRRRARRSPARPRSRCSRPPPTARSRRCGSPAPTRRSRCPTRRPCGARCERAEFVVVQEAFATTATCAYADLLLPATTWGEKDGTVTNSERRISRVRAAVPPPGQARHDWAHRGRRSRAGSKRMLRPAGRRCFRTPTPESIWNEHRESTRGRDLDITGLELRDAGGRRRSNGPARQAPPGPRAPLRGRPLRDRRRPRRASPTWRTSALAEPRDARYPFSLTTGRLRDQWHGMSRTGTLGRLFGHVRRAGDRDAPQDMARLRLADGDLVHVTSRRGSIVLPARASDAGRADAGLHRDALGRGVRRRIERHRRSRWPASTR